MSVLGLGGFRRARIAGCISPKGAISKEYDEGLRLSSAGAWLPALEICLPARRQPKENLVDAVVPGEEASLAIHCVVRSEIVREIVDQRRPEKTVFRPPVEIPVRSWLLHQRGHLEVSWIGQNFPRQLRCVR